MKHRFFEVVLAGMLLAGVGAQTVRSQTTITTETPNAPDTKSADTKAAASAPKSQPSKTTSTPDGVEVEIGIVSRIGGNSISNYTSSNGVLSLKNLGRATPQLLTGLGFSCQTTSQSSTTSESAVATTETVTNPADKGGICNPAHHLSRFGAFVATQFGSGSTQTISGYSVGATYAPYKNLRLLAGFSMSPVSEISPGFATAAAQYVTKNPGLFPGVNPANLSPGNYGAFDGFQTTSTAPMANATPTSTIYYPGSVTETHYRGGFIIGVTFPINVYSLLSGNSKSSN